MQSLALAARTYESRAPLLELSCARAWRAHNPNVNSSAQNDARIAPGHITGTAGDPLAFGLLRRAQGQAANCLVPSTTLSAAGATVSVMTWL